MKKIKIQTTALLKPFKCELSPWNLARQEMIKIKEDKNKEIKDKK